MCASLTGLGLRSPGGWKFFTPPIPKDLDMLHPTFATPDLTTFCRLDELGLVAVGQLIEPEVATIECRLAHEPFGHHRPRCWCGCPVAPLSQLEDVHAGAEALRFDLASVREPFQSGHCSWADLRGLAEEVGTSPKTSTVLQMRGLMLTALSESPQSCSSNLPRSRG